MKETIADPAAAVKAVLNHNDVAREAVELERLQMALEQNVVTDEVRANGLGGVVMERLAKSIVQISDTMSSKTSHLLRTFLMTRSSRMRRSVRFSNWPHPSTVKQPAPGDACINGRGTCPTSLFNTGFPHAVRRPAGRYQ